MPLIEVNEPNSTDEMEGEGGEGGRGRGGRGRDLDVKAKPAPELYARAVPKTKYFTKAFPSL